MDGSTNLRFSRDLTWIWVFQIKGVWECRREAFAEAGSSAFPIFWKARLSVESRRRHQCRNRIACRPPQGYVFRYFRILTFDCLRYTQHPISECDPWPWTACWNRDQQHHNGKQPCYSRHPMNSLSETINRPRPTERTKLRKYVIQVR